jgi:small subunit ribosomal protein S4
MLVGPKYKICKRLGASVFEKCQTQKFQLAAERSPRKTRGKRGGSDYGAQLIEKQKARFTYGLSETQFSRYVHDAMEKRGDSAQQLVGRLEARLDNVIYRAGFVRTRRAARQLVSHGHITVNGIRMTVPSHRVEIGDVVAVREGSRGSALFALRTEQLAELSTPSWMTMGEGGMSVTIASEPTVEATQLSFDASVIVQFYSR